MWRHRLALIHAPARGDLEITLYEAFSRLGPEILDLTFFHPGEVLPHVPRALQSMVADRMSLAPFTRALRIPDGPRLMGVPQWHAQAAPALNRLTGLLAPFDTVICFGAAALLPVLQRLRGLGVETHVAHDPELQTTRQMRRVDSQTERLSCEDEAAALTAFPGAYQSVLTCDHDGAGALAAMGLPSGRLDPGGARLMTRLAQMGRADG